MTEPPMDPSRPVDGVGGARWCAQHRRWECTHQRTKGRGQCHKPAIRGTDTCDIGHGGKSTAVLKAEGEARITLARAASQMGPVHPGELLMEANRLNAVVLRWCAGQVEEGAMSEAKLEVVGQWLDRAGRLAKAALDADASDRFVRAQESVASRDADRVQAIYAAAISRPPLNRSWDEPEVRAAFVAALDEVEAGGGG